VTAATVMRFDLVALPLAATCLFLAGCAPATRVVLLPQPDGRPSAVTVASSATGAQLVLDAPYAQADISSMGGVARDVTDEKTVRKNYAQLLAITPAPAQHFTLHFVLGSTELTTESLAELDAILTKATALPGGEILVTGHTDRVGAVSANDALSLQRATLIRDMIVQRGFDPLRVYAAGRGERKPIVPTADEVEEPRNRRVEIEVR
jgi:outer membrane protein OmpA-like peptidoglycan-associated protein